MSKTIAIIDDEVEMEYIYSMMLESEIKSGLIRMKFFQDPREFLDWYRLNEPDLILTDINMPHITGPELTQAIRKAGRSIPIYFVSGHEEREYLQVMKELGVCRFLPKPLNFIQVLGLIELDLGLRPEVSANP